MNAIVTTSAAQAQQEIAEEFAFFGDWTERYQYLIDLGKQLPSFPETGKTEEYRVHGCQSMVWLVPGGDASNMHFEAISDRSEEHTSELQSLMRISYAVLCLKKKKKNITIIQH